ncbi:hypothetical protein ACHAQJ_009510 [Trichoderma viride]
MASQLPPGTDLCQIPAAVPPPGVIPDLNTPPPLAPALIAVTTVMLTFSVIFTVGRFWINIHKLKIADYFAMIGLVLSIGYSSVILSMVRYAGHQWNAPACWFDATYMKLLFSQGMFIGPNIFFAKASILLLYLQLFGSIRSMRIAVYLGLVWTGLTYWPSIPLQIALTAPWPGETWDSLLTNGRPEKLIYWGTVQGTLAVVLDLYIFILPLPVLWKLNMSRKRRIGVCAIFFTASMGVIASIFALKFRIALLGTTDIIYVQNQSFISVTVENNIALIVSSIPAWKTIWKKHIVECKLYKTLTSKLRGNSGGNSGGTHVSRGFGLNRPASKKRTPPEDNYSEKSLERFVSHAQGGGSCEFGGNSPPVVQIQGGSKDEHGKPDFENASAGGIVRNTDITREVHPDNQV